MPLAPLMGPALERQFADDYDAERCWFFVHIPKTAGSSFRAELGELLSPSVNVHIDDDDRPLPASQKLIDATKSFNDLLKKGSCRFASGHVPMLTLIRHVEGWCTLKLITMLRDPVDRVVSNYRYQTTAAHPAHSTFVERFPNLVTYIESAGARNKIFRYLKPSAGASVEECRDFILRHFYFVGLVEAYPLSFRLLSRQLGEERNPSRYERKTMESAQNSLTVSPELIERIRRLNRFDMELYEYFHERILSNSR